MTVVNSVQYEAVFEAVVREAHNILVQSCQTALETRRFRWWSKEHTCVRADQVGAKSLPLLRVCESTVMRLASML